MGAVLLLSIYCLTFLLYVIVPGRWVKGYVRERYHLNGLIVFVLMIGAYIALGATQIIQWDVLYAYREQTLTAAFVVGLLFSFVMFWSGRPVKNVFADFYLGRLENPQAGRIDAKMFLYLIGAVMLALNLLSFAAHHTLRFGYSPGVMIYTALFLFFLTEYLFFERVHLYTYDFVAERVGFKLGWGCLVFYPFFYCIGLWFAADEPSQTPTPVLFIAPILFFLGWSFARGANMQKFYFKIDPARTRVFFVEQRSLGGRVLVSGYWGLSRHINYLGEILMASALALALWHPAGLLYPIYYLVLLVPRQFADDKRCAQKYGPLWDDYLRAVPYRIVPWVF